MNFVSNHSIRKPAVADQFYPADKHQLQRMVDDYLGQCGTTSSSSIKAVIAPHAGYIYSASIAACAYAALKQKAAGIQKVILIGPSHRVGFNGIATSSAEYYRMPFGDVLLDQSLTSKVSGLPQVEQRDDAHLNEHSLEVQLPFLQTLINDFTLLPLVVGDCDPALVAEALDVVWGGEDTLLVISSDLSHYLSYEKAQQMDRQTAQAITDLTPEHIHYEHACGRNPVNGLLIAAKNHRLSPHLLELKNSGDTAGLKDRVVGYGSFMFTQH